MTGFRYRAVARVCIELTAPLSIGSGEADERHDLMLVRDVNDLPTMPATSMAGVLRHAYEQRFGAKDTAWLFGKSSSAMRAADQRRTADNEKKEYDASRLSITWAAIHNSQDKPVAELEWNASKLRKDPLLAMALSKQPQKRDRVRLNHKGTAAFRGKFDRGAVPAGNRFTFELCLKSEEQDAAAWKNLLSLLKHADLRLGGATRSGLGSFRVVRILARKYDLEKEQDFQAFCARSRTVAQPLAGGTDPNNLSNLPKNQDEIEIKLELKPEDFWRVGQGTSRLGEGTDKAPDMLQYTEQKVTWNGDKGSLSKFLVVVPASGIKGALAHRVAYHDRVSRAEWFDANSTDEPSKSEAVVELFGDQKDDDTGQAGRVFIDDIYLDVPNEQGRGEIWHNGIDRFSGGVRHSVLFGEESIFNQHLSLRIRVKSANSLSAGTRDALIAAVADLAEGRLALGAGASRGQGYFSSRFNAEAVQKNWPKASVNQTGQIA